MIKPANTKLTKAQTEALEWLHSHHGDGVLLRGNVVLAAGEIAPHKWATWKALIESGHVERYQAGKGRRVRAVKASA